jgi:hypothetical protein
MRPGAILINTARGALVDEDAMIDALRSGHLRHAGLDVFTVEPLPAGHVLTTLPNVTLSAHSAFRTAEANHQTGEAEPPVKQKQSSRPPHQQAEPAPEAGANSPAPEAGANSEGDNAPEGPDDPDLDRILR